MSRDNHGAGPCAHCDGSGKCWDARIGDIGCPECEGSGHFDDNGEPVSTKARYCWDCAANVKAACAANCLLGDGESA